MNESMNKWQQIYCNIYYNGEMPNDEFGKENLALLEPVKEKVYFKLPSGRVKVCTVTEDQDDLSTGLVSVPMLLCNLFLWERMGFPVEFE